MIDGEVTSMCRRLRANLGLSINSLGQASRGEAEGARKFCECLALWSCLT
jgi:hypothetical protein